MLLEDENNCSVSSAADLELLSLLSTEIARDGGASLVVDLKNYHPSISRLLRQTTASNKKKLLSFLEAYHQTFYVDRNIAPHYVRLLVGNPLLSSEKWLLPERSKLRQALLEKVTYILRKRNSKILRRQNPADKLSVNVSWLLTECARDLHMYLRASGYYIHNQCCAMLKSSVWYSLVLNPFTDIIAEVVTVKGSKAWLSEGHDGKSLVDLQSPIRDSGTLGVLVTRLLEAMKLDGANRISLGLLIQRQPTLRTVLGGNDLITLQQEHPDLFTQLCVSVQAGHVFLECPANDTAGRRLPHTDDVGRFSVMNRPSGRTLTNLLVQYSKGTAMALDLTASIGGWTLQLAQVFETVLAVEIDSHRAECCRKNLVALTNVQVVTADAIEIVESWSKKLEPSVVVLDPPWGGPRYKTNKTTIAMGQWSLNDVVLRVLQRFHGAILGVRLPVTFHVDEFVNELKLQMESIELKIARKIGPQLILALGVSNAYTRVEMRSNEAKF